MLQVLGGGGSVYNGFMLLQQLIYNIHTRINQYFVRKSVGVLFDPHKFTALLSNKQANQSFTSFILLLYIVSQLLICYNPQIVT